MNDDLKRSKKKGGALGENHDTVNEFSVDHPKFIEKNDLYTDTKVK